MAITTPLAVILAGVLAANLVLLPFSIDKAHSQTPESGISLLGQGLGEFTCNNSKTVQNVKIFILLSDSTTRGLTNSPSGMGLHSLDEGRIAIKLSNGKIDSGNFSVQGTLLVDEICGQDWPLVFTANGVCGVDTVTTINSSDGSSGSFLSNVTCF